MLNQVINTLVQAIENKNIEANLVSNGKNSITLGNSDDTETTLKNVGFTKPSRDEAKKYLSELPDNQLYTLAAVINAGKDGFDLGTTFDPVNETVALAKSQFHSREEIINSIVANPVVIDDFESGTKWMPDGLQFDDVLKSVAQKLN
jgi:hypothetical protein